MISPGVEPTPGDINQAILYRSNKRSNSPKISAEILSLSNRIRNTLLQIEQSDIEIALNMVFEEAEELNSIIKNVPTTVDNKEKINLYLQYLWQNISTDETSILSKFLSRLSLFPALDKKIQGELQALEHQTKLILGEAATRVVWLLEEQRINTIDNDLIYKPVFKFPKKDLFIGREKIVDKVSKDLIKRTRRLVTLFSGIPGVGKTSIACKIAEKIAPNYFPDGVVFIDLEETSTTQRLIVNIANSLKLDYVSSIDILLNKISKLKLLLIFDNLELVIANDNLSLQRLIRDLLRYTEISILSTSREWIGVVEEQQVQVKPLNSSESKELLLELLKLRGARINKFTRISEILTFCDGIPLVIELVSSWYPMFSSKEFISQFGKIKSLTLKNPKLSNTFDKYTNYEISTKITYEKLSIKGQWLLRHLCVLPAAVSQDMLLVSAHLFDLNSLIQELYRWNLIYLEKDLVRILTPIREVVRRFANDEERRRIAFIIFSYFLGLSKDESNYTKIVITQHANLTFALLTQLEFPDCDLESVVLLVLTTQQRYFEMGLLTESYEILAKLIEVMKLRRNKISYEIYFNYGNILRLKDQYKEASDIYCEALLNTDLPEIERATILFGLGNTQKTIQQYFEAESSFKGALKIYESTKENYSEQAACLWGIANVNFATSQWEGALTMYKQALEIYNKLPETSGHKIGQIDCLKGLCDIYLKKRDYGVAMEVILQAHSLYYENSKFLSNRLTEAKIQQGLGDAARLTFINNIDTSEALSTLAEDAYKKAARLYYEMDAPLGEALSYYKLGELIVFSRTPEEAKNYFLGSKVIFSKCKNNNLGLSKSLLALSKLQLMQDRANMKIKGEVEQLITVFSNYCKSKYWEAEGLLVLAACNIKLSFRKKAQILLLKANGIFAQIGRLDKILIGERIYKGYYTKYEAFME